MSRYNKTPAAEAPAPTRKSGRAVFDEYGRTTWEWQTSTGVFERHITEEQLHALAPSLQLVEAEGPRPFEGLWVHDSHRPAPKPRVSAGRHRETRVVRTSFWQRLWGR